MEAQFPVLKAPFANSLNTCTPFSHALLRLQSTLTKYKIGFRYLRFPTGYTPPRYKRPFKVYQIRCRPIRRMPGQYFFQFIGGIVLMTISGWRKLPLT
ncbi:hypothetical protein P171DRAFT_114292 [Karstenula rhodostoma CBS 690.94]|uniref:Uncharacterized protein n=1 Tax=Karstenula rhodostoma CBS 690.94 TaxID=1392251 RepID=A0A9P4P9H7_9PLEO|nr:hypothetical protein P171DRAFT_114292 [Karstenula rhodostoma CBS 690.94]